MRAILKRIFDRLNNEHGFVVTTSLAIATTVGTAMTAGLGAAALTGGAAATLGAATLATGAYGVRKFMQSGMKEPAPMQQQYAASQQPTAQQTVQQSQKSAEAERKKVLARRSKTILTGPTGLETEAETTKKSLLGS